MNEILDQIRAIVGADHVATGAAIHQDDTHDECLTVTPVRPAGVVRPGTTAEVAAVLRCCNEAGVTVTARGAGSGLSGACVGVPDGLVMAFDRMAEVIRIDVADQMAVVQPGITLAALDDALAPYDLVYPVEPGEPSATVGGTVATNAGGMRAVRYGVTRQHVVGLQMVLASGTVLRSGGRLAKLSTGYDLTQLVVGSEGTLALVTEVTIRLQPRPKARATILAPFADLPTLAAAIPAVTGSGVDPLMLEYLDVLSMTGVTQAAGIDLAVDPAVGTRTNAYLIVALQSRSSEHLQDDVELTGAILTNHGALDVYVLSPRAGADLVTARERAFFAARSAGADDIVDVVVPRSAMSDLLLEAASLGAASGSLVTGCGHAGDGNIHLSIFQPNSQRRQDLIHQIFRHALDAGGAISGEHGLGRAKRDAFLALADPNHLALLDQIKAVFDPRGILGPGVGPARDSRRAEAAPGVSAGTDVGPGGDAQRHDANRHLAGLAGATGEVAP